LTAENLYRQLLAMGCTMAVDGGQLVVKGPGDGLSAELRTEVNAHKADLKNLISCGDSGRHDSICRQLGEVVSTPKGRGRLWQVFRDRVGVVLDATPGRVTFFQPRSCSFFNEKLEDGVDAR